jgi:hypothetical protein
MRSISYFQTGERPSSMVYNKLSLKTFDIHNFLSRIAYQSLHKASNQARDYNYISDNGLTHNWINYYRNANIRSNQVYVNEWNQMDRNSVDLYQM